MGFWLDLVLMTVLESYMDPWWNPISWRLSLDVTPKRAPMLHNMLHPSERQAEKHRSKFRQRSMPWICQTRARSLRDVSEKLRHGDAPQRTTDTSM